MKVEELSVLLPCHSLEDFPTHYEGDEATGLLAAWTSLWHPGLIAACRRVPTWHRADSPPSELAGRVFVVPPSSEPLLEEDFAAQSRQGGAHVVNGLTVRNEIVTALLAALDAEPAAAAAALDPELVADFHALGFCYLSVELLTRQMRYMSNVDEVRLNKETVAAAVACAVGDKDAARQHLQNSFETLVEARERFYPVDAYLVDLTLVAASTLGEPLRRQLAMDVPQNLLIAGELLDRMADTAPDTLAALRVAIERGSVTLVGGERTERELPLLPIENVLAEFRAGAEIFARHTGTPPRIYGRRRYGLSPLLPQLLAKLGYEGVLHATLDDGRFATATQSKVRWEGIDMSSIDALTRVPLDANRPETFLELPRVLGESMDRDHVATIIFAHWPAHTDTCYDDLRRMARYGNVLGRFMTLSDYFATTTSPGEIIKFKPDGYSAPYLVQAVAAGNPNPISAVAAEHVIHARQFADETIDTLADVVTGTQASEAAGTARLARAVAGGDAGASILLINPQSFSRRAVVDVSSLGTLPIVAAPVIAAQESGGHRVAIVDVPGNGVSTFAAPAAHTSASSPPTQAAITGAKSKKAPPSIAAENALTNDLVRVEINPTTGGIHGLYDRAVRGKLLSSQLAMRLPAPRPQPGSIWSDPEDAAVYSTMEADSLEITQTGTALGEIECRGRLLAETGEQFARYTVRYQLAAGARHVIVETELSIDRLPTGNPWESYYAARFAWSDEAAELYRDVGMARQPTESRRLEAPHFIELHTAKARIAILTGGLPYHRRAGMRMLDSLMVVSGETERRFRYGIGIGLAHPIHQALDMLHPVVAAPVPSAPQHASHWLFHIDARNVMATHWSSVVEEGRVVGFRVRLIETAGLAGRAQLRCVRDLAAAQQVDFRGEVLAELPVDGDSVTIDTTAFEWIEIVARLRV